MMDTRDLIVGTIFLFQTVFGTLGNCFLLFYYFFLYFMGFQPRCTDLIVKNLILANFLVLFSSGIYNILLSFGWLHSVSDLGCKFAYYIRGVGRGVSIGTTCILSVFQAITICPRSSRWAELKGKTPQYICPSLALCWTVNMLVNVVYLVFMSHSLYSNSTSTRKSIGDCSSVRHDQTIDSLYALLLSFPDVVFFVVMVWASGSMVATLYRHKQRVQYLHRTSVSSKFSPESRVTQTILFLVSTFIYFNTISSICQATISVFRNPDWFLIRINRVITLCFPTVCPFLLLSRESSVSKFCSVWVRKKAPPIL